MSSDEYVDMLVRIDHQELLHTYIDDRIRNNMDDVRKFIHPLIAYTNGQEILRIYMRNNALQFTMDDLEFACSKLNASVVQEIVNSNILPNEKCIESVFQYVNAHNAYQYPKSVCHIIAIFIHCGCTIPEHILRRVLRCAQNMSTADMQAIYKYGFTSPDVNNPIPNKIPDSD